MNWVRNGFATTHTHSRAMEKYIDTKIKNEHNYTPQSALAARRSIPSRALPPFLVYDNPAHGINPHTVRPTAAAEASPFQASEGNLVQTEHAARRWKPWWPKARKRFV